MSTNKALGTDPDVLAGMLAVAVMGEMASVTEASMEMFLASRDRYLVLCEEAVMLTARVKAVYEEADGRELTEAERAVVEPLKERITAAYKECDEGTSLGLICSHGDELLYGGKHCAKVFATMANVIAHLAQQPGGVCFSGMHWCAGSGHRGTADRTPCDAEVAREVRDAPDA